MHFPPAIIAVNAEISDSVKFHLKRQLFINEILDGYVFDNIVNADPNWINIVKQLNQRILVLRSFDEWKVRGTNPNWLLQDIVMWIKNGLAYSELNKFGPPFFAIRVLGINWPTLGIY